MTNILKLLLSKIKQNKPKIDLFFQDKLQNPLFYNSIDLRHSGFKIAPIDANCFPAGFNNLSVNSKKIAEIAMKSFFDKKFPNIKKILILSESHTRNLRYLENIIALQEVIINSSNSEVRIGSLIADIENTATIDLENGQKIILEKLSRNDDRIITKNGFCPDLIITNNDFTAGVDKILQNIAQQIIPSPNLGWYVRKKSTHFDIYNKVVSEFCQIIDLDPWLISTMHYYCDNVNFQKKQGIECLATYVDKLINELRKKYLEYGIKSEPYCYIKADNGTYGMAIMTVKSGAEILEINKKNRNKMSSVKSNILNSSVIIQEGIPTTDLIKNIIAEPMIYLIGGEVVGNLFRVNNQRDDHISLNASGMGFFDLSNLNEEDLQLGLTKDDIYKIYNMIAKLSAIATTLESY
jgi:glutamate--cysteine ligase